VDGAGNDQVWSYGGGCWLSSDGNGTDNGVVNGTGDGTENTPKTTDLDDTPSGSEPG
jgi:hypothetical protein